MSDKLDYFRGFKDGLNDAADLMLRLAQNAPEELNMLASEFAAISQVIKNKADAAYAIADKIGETEL